MTSGVGVAVVDACRVPIGRVNGMYRDMRADDLLAHLYTALVHERVGIDPSQVDEVIAGCVLQTGEQSFNVGRNAWLQAGLPPDVPGFTLDMQCGSGQQAVHLAARSVRSGDARCVVVGGVDVMTRSLPEQAWHESMGRPGHAVSPDLLARYPITSQGIAAERIAEKWGIGRDEMDELGVESHRRAVEAMAMGRFGSELVDVVLPDGSLAYRDEGMRPDFNLERARALQPVFEKAGGRITAAHSSQVSDGAAVALLCSDEFAAAHGLPVRAHIRHAVTVGGDPVLMLTAVIGATTRLLAEAGIAPSDIDVYEVNEAFASVVLAWQREIGVSLERVNPNGGAIALGHPVGATGARLLGTLVAELERRGGGRGVQAMCVGLGIGVALLVEVGEGL
ncbi:MAG: thiolase family protein [Actinomycetota bacterium]